MGYCGRVAYFSFKVLVELETWLWKLITSIPKVFWFLQSLEEAPFKILVKKNILKLSKTCVLDPLFL